MCATGALARLKTQHQEDPSSSTLAANKPTLLRSLFTVGALCRHFDFDQEEFKGANKVNFSTFHKCYFLSCSTTCFDGGLFCSPPVSFFSQIIIKEKVLELLLYFTTHVDEEVQIKAIIGLGMLYLNLHSHKIESLHLY